MKRPTLLLFAVVDNNSTLADVDVQLEGAVDLVGNPQLAYLNENAIDIDTENPTVLSIDNSIPFINTTSIDGSFILTAVFTEAMNSEIIPDILFTDDSPMNTLEFVSGEWIDLTTYEWTYSVLNSDEELYNITANISVGEDLQKFSR